MTVPANISALPPERPGAPALTRPHVQAWVGLALVMALVAVVGALQLQRTHDRITDEQQSRLQTQARVVAENMVRQLRGVDNALRGVRADLEVADTDRTEVSSHRLHALSEAMPGVRGIMVLDAKGTVVISEKSAFRGQDFSRRDYFSTPKERPDYTVLYVSSPFRSTLGVYSINLTKAVPDRRGQFAGVISANLDPAYFEIVARSVLYAPDMLVSIIHGNGELFIDARHEVSMLGADTSTHGSMVGQHIASEREETVTQGVDPVGASERMVVLRTVFPRDLDMDTPLVVAVSRGVHEVYAPWRDDVLTYTVLFLLLCTSASITLHFAQQRRLALWRAASERQALVARNAEQLANAAELQRRTGRLAKVGGWQLEVSAMQTTWTDEMYEIHDLPREAALTYDSSLAHYLPDDRLRVEAAMHEAIDYGTPWSFEARVATARGRQIWVRTQGEAIQEDGKVVRLVGALQDITERVRFAADLQAANEKLERLTVTDGLTGVGNRRLFDRKLHAEWARCGRRGLPLGLLMVDIDHFKLYNDRYGHQGGDEVLCRVAEILARCVQRSGELVARYGGEEFAVLLPGSDADSASAVAEAFLAQLAQAEIAHAASSVSPFLTMSIGVASLLPHGGTSPGALLKLADNALYAAKRLGRNRAEIADAIDSLDASLS